MINMIKNSLRIVCEADENLVKEAICQLSKEIGNDKLAILQKLISTPKECVTNEPKGKLIAYTDGSYDSTTKRYGAGAVLIENDKVIKKITASGNDTYSVWNVAGECVAAVSAINYAIQNNYKEIIIIHDYQGISSWVDGTWKRKKEFSKRYGSKMDSLINQISVKFEKVKAHSGDYYNDMADSLSRSAIGK